jgi:septum formation protein
MAQEKAGAVASNSPDAWVIGADTVVTIDDTILGKPRHQEEALTMLLSLNGRRHEVVTAYCLQHRAGGTSVLKKCLTSVTFHSHTREVLQAYIASGDPMDKAGANGIQSLGSFLVREIEGNCANVIGLPIADLIKELLLHQVIKANTT